MNRALAVFILFSFFPLVTREQAAACDAAQQFGTHVQDSVRQQQTNEQDKQTTQPQPTPRPLPAVPSLSLGNSNEQKRLSLTDAISLTLQNNKEIEIARSGVQIAEVELNRARKNANGDSGRHAAEVAEQNLQAADARFRQVTIDTISNVQYAYWNIIFAIRDMMVKFANLNDAREILRVNHTFVLMGRMSQQDLIVVQAEYSNLEQVFLETKDTLIQAENALKYLIAVDKDDAMWNVNLTPTDSTDNFLDAPVSLPDLLKAALENRPDLRLQQIAEKINEIDQRYYKRGGEKVFDYQKSRLEGQRLKAERQKLELRVQVDLRNASQKLNNAKARLLSARDARINVEQILATEYHAFYTGETSTREILTSQARLRDARFLELRAENDFAKALAQLQQVTATTLR